MLLRSLTTAALSFAMLLSSGINTLQAQADERLSDPQILHATIYINQLALDFAKQAQEKAESKGVKDYIETQLIDHDEAMQEAKAMAMELEMAPEENHLSKSLKEKFKSKQKEVLAMKAADFEKAYLKYELAFDDHVISVVDSDLVKQARSNLLSQYLETFSAGLRGHRELSKKVLENL